MSGFEETLDDKLFDEDWFDGLLKRQRAGEELYVADKYAEAINVFTGILNDLPASGYRSVECGVHQYLGFSYMMQGDVTRGMREINFAIELLKGEPHEGTRKFHAQDIDVFLKEYFGLRPELRPNGL